MEKQKTRKKTQKKRQFLFLGDGNRSTRSTIVEASYVQKTDSELVSSHYR